MRARLSWLRILGDLVRLLCLGLRSRTSLAAENLFLPKQLAFYQERKVKPRRADNPTRLTLVLLSRWFNWRDALIVVRPSTLISWHRMGFRLFWRWKSEAGRPSIPAALQHLIRKMARENPTWGEERIANELLLKLGLWVSPRTVRKYLPKWPAAPPDGPQGDQRWAVFLRNHARFIVACDFCVVVTAALRVLYGVGGNGACLASIDSPQRDRPSHLRLDPPAIARNRPFRLRLPLHHPRPRRDLFSRTERFTDTPRPQGDHYASAQPAGELTLRTADRDSAAGVSGLNDSVERRTSEKNPGVVDGPLQRRKTAFFLGRGIPIRAWATYKSNHADTAFRLVIKSWPHRS